MSVRTGQAAARANVRQRFQSLVDPGSAEGFARRPVCLVIGSLENDGRGASASNIPNGKRKVDRVLRALDDARTCDKNQRMPAANRKRPNLDGIHGHPILCEPREQSRRSGRRGLGRAAHADLYCLAPEPSQPPSPACRQGLVTVRCLDEAGKQRVRRQRLRLELGMELYREKPRMRGQFRDFNELPVG